jgi:hypothetical protein
MITQEQFDRLPKYAQEEMNRINENLVYLGKQLDEIQGIGETNTFIAEGVDTEHMPLPNNSRIRFVFDKSREIECQVIDGKLHISGKIGALIVRPCVSNVIVVEEEVRY